VIPLSYSRLARLFSCASILALTPSFAATQAQKKQTPETMIASANPNPDTPSSPKPAEIAGDWQVSWTARLGVEKCVLHLQLDGTKLTGTFKDLHGVMPLSGTVDGNKITFEVQFGGKYPFTTRFTGSVNGGKIEGTSEAVGVTGGGAFLGHAGEVVHPEHPWTATRGPNQPDSSARTASNPNSISPAKN
jgi:hypothetical protein